MSDRPLSLHERYSVARNNCGLPHAITLVLSYPTAAAMPAAASLRERAESLQTLFPLLWASVSGAQTATPRFAARERPWRGAEVVHEREYAAQESREAEMRAVLKQAAAEMQRTGGLRTESPMWRVARHLPTDGGAVECSRRAYLTISVLHEITDGRGLLRLAEALLDPSTPVFARETLVEIPTLDATVDLRPPLAYLLPVIFRELVTPRVVPDFVRRWLRGPSHGVWPAKEHILRPPTKVAEWDMSLLCIPAASLITLKAAGAARGVPALHATLQTAYLAAIWAVITEGRGAFCAKVAAPLSERDKPLLGHAFCTGNYVSSYECELRVDGTSRLWTLAAELARDMRSDAGRSRARHAMGMLAYIPDPAGGESGWESYLMAGPFPKQALNMSNLGAFALPRGCDDAIWAQGVSPFGPAFAADVIGHAGGLRIVTGWREGAVVTARQVQLLEKVLLGVIGALCATGDAPDAFAELVK